MSYVRSFMLLYRNEEIQIKYMIWVPKSPQKEETSLDSRNKEENSLPAQLNTTTGPPPLGTAGDLVPRRSAPRAPAPSPSPDSGGPVVVSRSHTCQDTSLDQRATQIQAGRSPLNEVLIGGVLSGFILVRSQFSTSDLLNWKTKMPPYLDDPIGMKNFFASIFAIHNPTWADIQTLLKFFLTPEERSLILEQARAEADKMHEEAPYNPVRALGDLAIPTTDP